MTIKSLFSKAVSGITSMLVSGWNRTGDTWVDEWRVTRAPSKHRLVEEYRGLAYALANINARAVAATPYKLYVKTAPGDKRTKLKTKKLSSSQRKRLVQDPTIASKMAGSDVEEVTEHPLLTLLEAVNDEIDGFTLFELTDLYQEVCGTCYWYIEMGLLNEPVAIWVVPSQHVTPVYFPGGGLSHYDYVGAIRAFEPDELISFKFPNLKDPYGEGWSPTRAAFETLNILNKDTSYASAMLDNQQRPDIIVTPKEGIGEEESKRLEKRFAKKFKKGGAGGILVAESGADVKTLSYTSREMEALQRKGISKQDLANIFDVPLSILVTADVSRANAEAGHYQHAKLAVLPRVTRLQQRINQKVCPLFDGGSGRLFLAFDNPVPEDKDLKARIEETQLRTGRRTINELREQDGEEAVEWGDEPWLPSGVMQPTAMALAAEEESELARMTAAAGTEGKPNDATGTGADGKPAAGGDQEMQVTQETVLNGTQSATLLSILEAIAAGRVPRDSGVQMVMVAFNLPVERAEQIVGSAGTSTPTTPNPGAVPEPEPVGGDEGGKPPKKPGEKPKEKPGDKSLEPLFAVIDEEIPPYLKARKLAGCFVSDKTIARLLYPDHKHLLDDMEKKFASVEDYERDWEAKRSKHGKKLPTGKPLAVELRSIFNQQRKEILSKIRAHKSVSRKAWYDEMDVDLSGWDEKMAKGARPFLEMWYDDGGKKTNKVLARAGYTEDAAKWNVSNPKAKEAIDKHSFVFSEDTNETTSKSLKKAIKELKEALKDSVLGEENTAAELTARVNEIFDYAEEWRAARIALTESSRAVHGGQYLAAKESGIISGFKWLLSDDACPICTEIAGKHPEGVALGASFMHVDDVPPEYSEVPYPPAHPHCMCTVEEVIDESKLQPEGDE